MRTYQRPSLYQRTRKRHKVWKTGALREAQRILTELESSTTIWTSTPPEGYMRGVDFYSKNEMAWALGHAIYDYKIKFGRYPEIVSPKGFNEKVIWRKFFGLFKTPESGNKLATPQFIPPELKGILSCAEVVWRSREACAPRNHEVAPGVYYFKANFGCNMFTRVTYPINDRELRHLSSLASTWLRSRFGIEWGEWWYNTCTPEVMLEKSVCGDEDAVSWNFFVINGNIPMIGLFQKKSSGEECSTWLDHEFNELQLKSTLPPVRMSKPTSSAQLMMDWAKKIAEPFSAVRVDFLLSSEDRPFLSELTFTPGNGMARRSPEVESLLSTSWRELF